MARRKVTARRAWLTSSGTFTLIRGAASVDQTDGDLIMEAADIGNTEVLLSNERTEFYTERIILWFRPVFTQVSESVDRNDEVFLFTLGVTERSTTSFADSDLFDAGELEQFNRVLQQEFVLLRQHQALGYTTNFLRTNNTTAIDKFGYPTEQPIFKWDLKTKLRLPGVSGGLQFFITQPGGSVSDSCLVEWWVKVLLRRS